ncbi:MAG: ribonuclease III [Clostridiales bacterium]|nr:ribonuclease III [Clostridiales bacterium]MBS5877415.1 ribonuclease III [Clostridiales bacterium]
MEESLTETDKTLSFCDKIVKEVLGGEDKNPDPRLVSPLLLAYVGDSIFDLVVRTALIKQGNRQVNKVNRSAITYVKAASQAKMAAAFNELMTEEEKRILKAGKNAKPNTKAKNASLTEYHTATGLEAMFGYLYLQGEMDRIIELVRLGMEHIDKEG